MIVCFGSIALDTTRTPFRTVERVLGGSASFFSLSASFFAPVGVVSAVGRDFPQEYWSVLEKKGVDLSGVQKREGKTFFFDSSFGYDLHGRTVNKTELNVYADFQPVVPDRLKKTRFLYLGTNLPSHQKKLLEEIEFQHSFLDTIEFYIREHKQELLEVVEKVDGVVLNDVEARMLCKTENLVKAAFEIQKLGPEIVLIKKGEHGSLLFYDNEIYPFPAYPLENVVDPTGAGDAFAGGFVGHLARAGLNRGTLKQALVYANIMGSFAVEDFSVNGLLNRTPEQVEERFARFKKMLEF